MLLVICGAGASYDSAPSRHPQNLHYRGLPNRPPLANDLFGDRETFGHVLRKYRRCLPIIPRLRHIPGNSSVESVLQTLQAEAAGYPEGHNQLAAIRYYLQEILWSCGTSWRNETHGVSNYSALVDTIKRWKHPDEKVCFVTFNYDTLLDEALRDAGCPLRNLREYISGKLMLVKLHGSVDWGRRVGTVISQSPPPNRLEIANVVIDHYTELSISKDYLMIGEYPPPLQDKMPLLPALAIPVEEKLDFECPYDHIQALNAFIPNVTKILTIGWRGTEKPFLDLLRAGCGGTQLRVMTVSGNRQASEETAERLRHYAGIAGQFSSVEYGFTDFMIQGLADGFLSQ